MENYYENALIAAEFRKSNEGKRLGGYIELLYIIASELLMHVKEFYSVDHLFCLACKAEQEIRRRVNKTGKRLIIPKSKESL